MKYLRQHFMLFICSLLFVVQAGIAQPYKRICVMGSSTSYGYFGNPAQYPRDSAWAFKLKKYYKDAGIIDTLYNIAVNGTDCYVGMPSTYVPPAGRNLPDNQFNITRAVNFNPKPDVIIVNYPTNNYDWLSNTEIINCLRTIKDSANANNIRCYITTTQPRNNFNNAERQKLKDLKALIETTFGVWAIDFWTDIVQDPPIVIRPEYAMPDGVHILPPAHTILRNKVIEKNIFSGVVLPVKFAGFSAQLSPAAVTLSWETLTEENNSHFIIEKSSDGTRFTTLTTIAGHNNSTSIRRYQYIDEDPLPGLNYYRLAAVSQTGEQQYSPIVKISYKRTPELISNLYPMIADTHISVVLGADGKEKMTLSITDIQGRQHYTKKIMVENTLTCNIPVSDLPPGTYILTVNSGNKKQSKNFIRR